MIIMKLFDWIKDFFARLFGTIPPDVYLCPICGRKCLYQSYVTNFTIDYICACGTDKVQYKKDMVHSLEVRYLCEDDSPDYYECLNDLTHKAYTITHYQAVSSNYGNILYLPDEGLSGDGLLTLGNTQDLWEAIRLNQWMAP